MTVFRANFSSRAMARHRLGLSMPLLVAKAARGSSFVSQMLSFFNSKSILMPVVLFYVVVAK
jgi:hypothetical protein